MYTTIEADIENGRIKGPECAQIPASAHVLITLLTTPAGRRPDWNMIKPLLGRLRLRGDTVQWQEKIRDEWK